MAFQGGMAKLAFFHHQSALLLVQHQVILIHYTFEDSYILEFVNATSKKLNTDAEDCQAKSITPQD
jgi:hypothetical protein